MSKFILMLGAICGSNFLQARESALFHIEMKSIDLPTFMTGERGPLFGRVVFRLRSAEIEPIKVRASIEIEAQDLRGEGRACLVYPGVSAAVDFPIELVEPLQENAVLEGVVRLEIEDRFSLSRRVMLYVRTSGMYFRTYRSSLDNTVYPFALYLPEGIHDSSKAWPLVVSLHGAYSNHANNLKRLMGIGNRPGEPDELALVSLPVWPELPRIQAIVVCPWGHGTMGYHGPGARDVLDVIELVRKSYPVDPERITVTGLSMGGNGTWEMALRHRPDLFAAAVPVCAFSDQLDRSGLEDLVKKGTENPPYLESVLARNAIANWAGNARMFPVHIHHGNDDPVVPVTQSEQMLKALRKAGVEVQLTRYDNVGHNSWDPAYQGAETLNWLLRRRREKPEKEIFFTSCRYANASYEWLSIERFEKYGEYATVKARWDEEKGQIRLETKNVARLNIYPGKLPGAQPGRKIRIISEQSQSALELSLPSDGPLELELKGGSLRRAEPVETSGKLLKRKGLEGPIYEVLNSRVVLVYGTRAGGHSTLSQALRFADWGELPDVHFIIKPDTLLDEQDIATSHLVLFGDESSNRLIARTNSRAPVQFAGEEVVAGKDRYPKAEIAFKCIFPNPLNPDKLLLLNFQEEWDYTRLWFYLAYFKQLPDYIFYRRGSDRPDGEKILKAGFFNENWSW